MARIQLKHLYKDYIDSVRAVTDFDLEIEDEEFIVLVGPSGCGKSTTLRMIAGLEDISSGEVVIDGKAQNNLHPKDRDIAMVFQNYALYPHMSVYDNIAFGLKMRKTSKQEIKERVTRAAKILDIENLLERKPKELSGGQRQRVALGRAIVREAKVFLMDEPLSNLDAKLRFQTRAEITKLHRRLKTTTIYVTHDQTEAMSMATRIVVMKDGIIQQVGTPKEIYLKPANIFVGKFIGSPAMNFFDLKVNDNGITLGDSNIELPSSFIKEAWSSFGKKELVVGIRPEDIQLSDDLESSRYTFQLSTKIDMAELMGSETLLYFTVDNQTAISKLNTMEDFNMGQLVRLSIDLEKVHFFDKETGLRLDLQEVQEAAKKETIIA
ncbi:ABC transporter ATP-binding protein [Oceanobacillus polygoni]|uniref:Multiple sugar transport system ATP-binding protein n=1 Tax=Oceanobacillus polygoni TaxID=1235259 RepID=A0A9X0Z1H0_9BACI|nr:sn-glycerol-3-phosphate ABC transporter ATP-binding protein UgpC [Oceanobacillus polygoni]MBP2079576.1 multiple sugar transport system ATP-binding protein [Oceanobacillus polygoni]